MTSEGHGIKEEEPPARWSAVAVLGGCLASGILGLLAIVWWIVLTENGSTSSRASAIIFVVDVLLIGLVGYRASRRKKAASVELGLIIGLALIALSAGLCALPGRP